MITLDEAIQRYKNNAEYERQHGNLQGCLEFRQLAKWLEELQKIEKIAESLRVLSFAEMTDIEWQILRVIDKYKVETVVEDGDVD